MYVCMFVCMHAFIFTGTYSYKLLGDDYGIEGVLVLLLLCSLVPKLLLVGVCMAIVVKIHLIL